MNLWLPVTHLPLWSLILFLFSFSNSSDHYFSRSHFLLRSTLVVKIVGRGFFMTNYIVHRLKLNHFWQALNLFFLQDVAVAWLVSKVMQNNHIKKCFWNTRYSRFLSVLYLSILWCCYNTSCRQECNQNWTANLTDIETSDNLL